MARIRSIKPEFWTDRSLARRLSRDARMLYMGLWNLADEHGRLNGDSYYIKGQIFPYDDDLTPGAIDALIDQLDDAGKAIRYADGGDPYLFLPRLDKHQRLEADKVPSKLPAPPEELPQPTPPQPEQVKPQASGPEGGGADSSARGSDESAPDANKSALLYVAGSMEHVAGSMEHVPLRADVSQPPLLMLVDELQPLTPSFDDFWEPWPRKVKKPDAQRAWDKAVGKKRIDPAVIIIACRAWAERCEATGQDPNFIPYPATWLNGEQWNDDLDAVMPLRRQNANGHVPYKNPTEPGAYSGGIR